MQAGAECDFEWTACRELLCGEYTFKVELAGDKNTFVKTDKFEVLQPYESAIQESGGEVSRPCPVALALPAFRGGGGYPMSGALGTH